MKFGLLTLRMEQRLSFFENRKLRNIFGTERDEENREEYYITRRFMIFILQQISFG
jgi:hypothetical protein